jgi:hypothetical protein
MTNNESKKYETMSFDELKSIQKIVKKAIDLKRANNVPIKLIAELRKDFKSLVNSKDYILLFPVESTPQVQLFLLADFFLKEIHTNIFYKIPALEGPDGRCDVSKLFKIIPEAKAEYEARKLQLVNFKARLKKLSKEYKISYNELLDRISE